MLKTLNNNKYIKLILVYALVDYIKNILMGLNSRFNVVTKKRIPVNTLKCTVLIINYLGYICMCIFYNIMCVWLKYNRKLINIIIALFHLKQNAPDTNKI